MSLSTPKFWYQERPSLCARVLSPLGALYNLSSQLHQRFKVPYKFSVPVLCVGNLTMGGSGKTPVCLALHKLLIEHGTAKTPYFLTRGYGGSVQAPHLVTLAQDTLAQTGDEARLLAQCGSTIISPDRPAGAKLAEKHGADLLIMDDGFQNRSLHKDLSLVVIDGQMGFGNGLVFPAGPLREELEFGLRRADGFILIGEDQRDIQSHLPQDKPLFQASLDITNLPPPSQSYVAFAGLGYPEKFFSTLKNRCNLHLIDMIRFPDHHPYREQEIQSLLEKARKANAQLITTEKDLIRIPEKYHPEIACLKIKLRFENENAVLQLIKDRAILNSV